jgi:SAM-dependent methyltransferase
VAFPALVALGVARSNLVGLAVLPDVAWITAVAIALFTVTGFGLTRFLLPEELRRHEWLWIVPVGAIATAFAMTPLGFLHVPFRLNLAAVVVAGGAVSVLALRRRGLPDRSEARALAWPVYLGALLMFMALVPLFRAGFLTVIGNGSDAHLAAGTAEFLKHAPPRGIDTSLPVDSVPLVWRSKQAIYYAFAAVSELTGLETWQVLSTLGALLLTLAAVGWFVFARETLAIGVGAAVLAMVIAGLDRMVIHTGIHPYFNQTWGYMTVPFTLALAWPVLRRPTAGGVGLLGLFLLVCAFAYPLALPIPALALAVMWWVDRRRRRRAGEQVAGLRDLRRRFRTLPRLARIAGYALLVVLVVPLFGVWEKLTGATQLLINPNYSLNAWGGDLFDWFPEAQFFSIRMEDGWWAALAVIAGFAAWELRRLPRPVGIGLLSVILAGAVVAATVRQREFGWYFHFKILAFIGPLVVVLGVVGMTRVRRESARRPVRWLMAGLLVIWSSWALTGARFEVGETFDQLPRTTQALAGWQEDLPPGASIRLDVRPDLQLWTAYMLADHPLCSKLPLLETSYPHVPVSVAADYALVRMGPRPADAVGAPLRKNAEYALYRLRPGLPGGDRCSQEMVQTVTVIERG